jgi:hypothetical protein
LTNAKEREITALEEEPLQFTTEGSSVSRAALNQIKAAANDLLALMDSTEVGFKTSLSAVKASVDAEISRRDSTLVEIAELRDYSSGSTVAQLIANREAIETANSEATSNGALFAFDEDVKEIADAYSALLADVNSKLATAKAREVAAIEQQFAEVGLNANRSDLMPISKSAMDLKNLLETPADDIAIATLSGIVEQIREEFTARDEILTEISELKNLVSSSGASIMDIRTAQSSAAAILSNETTHQRNEILTALDSLDAVISVALRSMRDIEVSRISSTFNSNTENKGVLEQLLQDIDSLRGALVSPPALTPADEAALAELGQLEESILIQLAKIAYVADISWNKTDSTDFLTNYQATLSGIIGTGEARTSFTAVILGTEMAITFDDATDTGMITQIQSVVDAVQGELDARATLLASASALEALFVSPSATYKVENWYWDVAGENNDLQDFYTEACELKSKVDAYGTEMSDLAEVLTVYELVKSEYDQKSEKNSDIAEITEIVQRTMDEITAAGINPPNIASFAAIIRGNGGPNNYNTGVYGDLAIRYYYYDILDYRGKDMDFGLYLKDLTQSIYTFCEKGDQPILE